jgi:SAM-dependent methyltransferase
MLDSKTWDRIWISELKGKTPSFYGFFDEAAMLIEENIAVNKKEYILEPGCGSGRLSLILAKKGANIVLLDVSREALRVAKTLFKSSHAGRKPNFVLGDLRCLPFRDNGLGAVINEGVIEHFIGNERQHVVDEMIRITAKGKRIAVLVPNSWNLPFYLYKNFIERTSGQWPWGLEVPYTPNELERRFTRSGANIIKKGGCRLFPIPYHLSCYPARLTRILIFPLVKKLGYRWLKVNAGYTVFHRKFAHYLFLLCEKKKERGILHRRNNAEKNLSLISNE